MALYQLTETTGTAPSFNPSGKIGGSLILDGTKTIATPHNEDILSVGTFTLEGWFKTSGTTGRAIMGVGKVCQIWTNPGGTLAVNWGGTEVQINSTINVRDGVWHHVACVADGNNGLRTYLDGVLIGTISGNISAQSPTTENEFVLGGYGPSNQDSLKFIGELDEVAIWTIAKYSANFTPSTTATSNTTPGLRLLAHLDSSVQNVAGAAAQAAIPGAPTNVVATAGVASASVAFSIPASDGGAAIAGYKVTASTGQTATGTASPIVVTGLAATPVTFTVQAQNAAGYSQPSPVSNSVTPTAASGNDVESPVLVSIATNGDGTQIELTYNEPLLGPTAPPISSYAIPGYTISGAAISGSKVILTISPAVMMESADFEMSYTKGSNPVSDLAGNQASNFSGRAVTNNVAPFAWKFLGYEGATVTVPANTTVRYGIAGSFATKVLSGSFQISNGTFGSDPASGATKYAEAYLAIPAATAVTVTMGTGGPVGVSPVCTLEANGFLGEAVTINLSGAGLTFNPASVTLGPNRGGYASATFTIAATAPVTTTVHFASASSLTLPADKPYTAAYEIIKSIGAGKDFATFKAFADYVQGKDIPLLGTHLVGEAYENLDGNGVSLMPANSSPAAHVIVRPAPGLGSPSSGALGFGTGGLKITGGKYRFSINQGVEIVDFDIDLLNDTASASDWYFSALSTDAENYGRGGAYSPHFTNCRIYNRATLKGFGFGGYGVYTYFDNCLIIQGGGSDQMLFNDGRLFFNGCGIVRVGSFTTKVLHNANAVVMENCWGVNLGSQISNNIDAKWGYFANNVLDAAITTGQATDYRDLAPVGYVVASNFVGNPVTDIVPTVGSTLIGGANLHAKSTSDMRGNNRGLTPDIGPIQRTPATPLAVARVASPTVPDGESLTLSGTTTNNPTSASVTFLPSDPADGAIRLGPFPVTLGTGTFTVTVDDIVAGNYQAPQLLFVNGGGVSTAIGATAFSINGASAFTVDGQSTTATPTDPGSGGGTTPTPKPAPTVSISTQDAATMQGKTATISGTVNLQGATDGQVKVFADPQPNGTPVDLGAANVIGSAWTKQAVLTKGQWKLRVVATANAQTASATTGTVRVLGLAGNFTLPT
jgi:hypothetical protein